MRRAAFTFVAVIVNMLILHSAHAEIRLPAIVSSNMVLQRDTTVVLWGWSNANERITLNTSWLDDPVKIIADEQGSWKVDVKTTGSRLPQTIQLKSKTSEITLNNILFGEVWLCSGQSNMQQSMKGYIGQPTYGSAMAVAQAGNPDLRLFSVDRTGSSEPLEELKGYSPWQEAKPELVSEFSALAYFFGQQLQEILDVPVGLIHTSYGGSKVQAWISKEVLAEYEDLNQDDINNFERPNRTQTVLYNAMINPLIPYTIKGVLWYQGESNRQEPEHYKDLFPAMVRDWRTRWGNADFPIYFVQISPYLYGDNEVFQSANNSAFMREAQMQCVDLISNSGIAITMDIGDKECIHPPKKKEVADRLLFNALNKTYGFSTLDCASPVFDSLEMKNDTIILSFENAETGLYAYGKLEGFEIAGEDRVFHPADAEIINRRKVLVKSDKVTAPVAVRYAWRNWVPGTLYDANLLPASSFRTDNWSLEMKVERAQ